MKKREKVWMLGSSIYKLKSRRETGAELLGRFWKVNEWKYVACETSHDDFLLLEGKKNQSGGLHPEKKVKGYFETHSNTMVYRIHIIFFVISKDCRHNGHSHKCEIFPMKLFKKLKITQSVELSAFSRETICVACIVQHYIKNHYITLIVFTNSLS